MLLANIGGWHLILLLVVILLLFGAARLPALAKGVGQSVRILKTETRTETALSEEGGKESSWR
ncbi:twin-arginine translocase TatA/TatE family subunit [Microbacterium sp. Leaf288]|uniref:twin-arginine translocase TatA/TatE family subunit n=1 Tax=Microbacterium sp. Leaf288 TaxID=1736323 RepID=UPI000AB6C374|nr:twin-arginine translocase TatA/TatE family subunit [Microbacterium sp. Leaf288]